jgi:hypothetical protein
MGNLLELDKAGARFNHVAMIMKMATVYVADIRIQEVRQWMSVLFL